MQKKFLVFLVLMAVVLALFWNYRVTWDKNQVVMEYSNSIIAYVLENNILSVEERYRCDSLEIV